MIGLVVRVGGTPRWIRVDNLKTAVKSDAGPMAVLDAALDERCAEWHATQPGPTTRMLIAEAFHQAIVSIRYERGSILLASDKHVQDWPEILAGDEILTTAILDSLLHYVAESTSTDRATGSMNSAPCSAPPGRALERTASAPTNPPAKGIRMYLHSR